MATISKSRLRGYTRDELARAVVAVIDTYCTNEHNRGILNMWAAGAIDWNYRISGRRDYARYCIDLKIDIRKLAPKKRLIKVLWSMQYTPKDRAIIRKVLLVQRVAERKLTMKSRRQRMKGRPARPGRPGGKRFQKLDREFGEMMRAELCRNLETTKKTTLMQLAKDYDVKGRSRMSKSQLCAALKYALLPEFVP